MLKKVLTLSAIGVLAVFAVIAGILIVGNPNVRAGTIDPVDPEATLSYQIKSKVIGGTQTPVPTQSASFTSGETFEFYLYYLGYGFNERVCVSDKGETSTPATGGKSYVFKSFEVTIGEETKTYFPGDEEFVDNKLVLSFTENFVITAVYERGTPIQEGSKTSYDFITTVYRGWGIGSDARPTPIFDYGCKGEMIWWDLGTNFTYVTINGIKVYLVTKMDQAVDGIALVKDVTIFVDDIAIKFSNDKLWMNVVKNAIIIFEN